MASHLRHLPISYRRAFIFAGAAASIASGSLVLMGWQWQGSSLTRPLSDLAPMKPLTAICFVLLGVSLMLLNVPQHSRTTTRTANIFAKVCAGYVATAGTVRMAVILAATDTLFARLLHGPAFPGSGATHDGRMSPASAIALFCLGTGLLLVNFERGKRWRLEWLGQVLSLIAIVLGFMALLGYEYGTRAVHTFGAHSSMSLQTSVLLMITGAASLLSFPREGLMAPVSSERLGGVMARWLLPAVIVVPLVLGHFLGRSNPSGLYTTDFGVLLLAGSRALLLGAIVWLGALQLNRLDSKRHQIEERDLRLAAMVDSSDDAIVGTTLEGIITSWNKGAEQVYGYSEAEVLGKPIAVIAPEELVQEIPAFLEKIKEGQGITHQETTRRHKSGSLIPVSLTISPVRDRSGNIIGGSSVARDITAQKKIAAALREQARVLDLARTQLITALEAGRMGTWVWDFQRNIGIGDVLSARLLGLQPGEAPPDSEESFLAMVYPEDRERVRAAFQPVLRGEEDTVDVEYRIVRGDNSVVWRESRGSLERDEKGSPLRLAGVLVDINTRKQMEEYLLQSQKLQSLGTLAGGIAHDFNNILMAIGGNAQLAMQQVAADDPVQRSLSTIAKASSRASFLVREILTFSRQEESKRKVIEVGSAVQEALSLLRATLPSRIEIRSQCQDNEARIFADPAQIQQIIMNLGANAGQAMSQGRGLIEVTVKKIDVGDEGAQASPRLKPGAYVCISFRDNGSGMAAGVVPRIFDPFFTTRGPQQTGLGLSVVHGILRNHDGAISVETEPGNGSIFHLYFPASQQAVQRIPAPMPVPSGRGERVLYVDDEEALVTLVSRSLKRLGYEISGYSDGAAALAAFKENPDNFDVVISDVAMPGMSGWELCAKLSAIRSSVPIILTSGYVRKEDQEMASQLGVLEVVLKPDTVDDLARALHRALERKPGPSANLNGNESVSQSATVPSTARL